MEFLIYLGSRKALHHVLSFAAGILLAHLFVLVSAGCQSKPTPKPVDPIILPYPNPPFTAEDFEGDKYVY